MKGEGKGKGCKRFLKRSALVIAIAFAIVFLTWYIASWPREFEQPILRAAINDFSTTFFPETSIFVDQETSPASRVLHIGIGDANLVAEILDERQKTSSTNAVRKLCLSSFRSGRIQGPLPENCSFMPASEIEEWKSSRFNGESTAATGLSVSLTRPVLIREDLAILGLSFWGGGLFAGGSIYVLEKRGSSWRIVDEIAVWAS